MQKIQKPLIKGGAIGLTWVVLVGVPGNHEFEIHSQTITFGETPIGSCSNISLVQPTSPMLTIEDITFKS